MNKLIINKDGEKINLYIYENENLLEQYEELENKPRLEGNIYLGEVKDVVKGMQSAFINIGEGKNALIHVKDIIQKESDITGNLNAISDNYDITKILHRKDKIIVQIKRDCTDQKGPRVTKDIKLIGKYVVIMPFSNFVTASQKISVDKAKALIEKCKANLPKGYGAIVRTAAIMANENEIENDIAFLTKKWKSILRKAKLAEKKGNVPLKLYDNDGILGKTLIDLLPFGVKVYTNSKIIEKKIKKVDDSIEIEITNQKNNLDLNKTCSVNQKKEAENSDNKIDSEPTEYNQKNRLKFDRKVWLKCGGFVTFDTTEALTAIDVNSGKFTGKNNLENTVLKVNLEATDEIAKQIRLRDIGGIIIIDYIDMENVEDINSVRDRMKEVTKTDRSKVQVLEFTKLGLLEMTRKHILGR